MPFALRTCSQRTEHEQLAVCTVLARHLLVENHNLRQDAYQYRLDNMTLHQEVNRLHTEYDRLDAAWREELQVGFKWAATADRLEAQGKQLLKEKEDAAEVEVVSQGYYPVPGGDDFYAPASLTDVTLHELSMLDEIYKEMIAKNAVATVAASLKKVNEYRSKTIKRAELSMFNKVMKELVGLDIKKL